MYILKIFGVISPTTVEALPWCLDPDTNFGLVRQRSYGSCFTKRSLPHKLQNLQTVCSTRRPFLFHAVHPLSITHRAAVCVRIAPRIQSTPHVLIHLMRIALQLVRLIFLFIITTSRLDSFTSQRRWSTRGRDVYTGKTICFFPSDFESDQLQQSRLLHPDLPHAHMLCWKFR